MIRRVASTRRLLRKRMYKAPHTRHRVNAYYRESNKAKPYQKEFKDAHAPVIRRKKRPKREVMEGFKMSYRYKYYMNDMVEEDENEEELDDNHSPK